MKTWTRGLISAAVVVLVFAVGVGMSSPAAATFLRPGIPSASGVTPVVASNFPGCSEGLTAYTWQGPLNGTQTTPEGLEITTSPTGQSLPGKDSRYFDFSVEGGDIAEVVVKTNVFVVGFITASNVYSYDNPTEADSKLHPPANYRNKPYRLDKVRFCYEPTVNISGAKWHDLDANGTRDDGEPGLQGWTITVSEGEKVVDEFTTGTGGSYMVEGLPPGSYTICESQQEGWHQSFPEDDGCHTTSVSAEGLDFGNYQDATISGVKFEDVNADGVRDEGEDGLAGWTITASSSQNSDATTDTDDEGVFSLTVLPGTYTVCEDTVEGWVQSYPGVGECHDVSLDSGEMAEDIDFGNYQLGSISGQRQINGEGFPNQEVTLVNGETSTTTTDEDGAYLFSGLTPGSYTICTEDIGGTLPSGGECDDGEVGTSVDVGSGIAVADVDFVDTVQGATVVSCTTEGANTGGSGLPQGTASAYCETKDGQELESIAIVYTSGFDIDGFAQRIDLEILGTPIVTQFVETLDFVPEPRTDDDDVEPVLEYDDGTGYRVAQTCKIPVEPEDLPVSDPSTVLRTGETTCIVEKLVRVVDPPDDPVSGATYVDIDFIIFWTQDPTRGFR